MSQSCNGRAGETPPEPFAAFLAVAEPRVLEPARSWQVRLCPDKVLDDQPSWQSEVKQGLTEGMAARAWVAKPGDVVRVVRVRSDDVELQDRPRSDPPEGIGAIVLFMADPTYGGTVELPREVQDLIKQRRRGGQGA